MALVHVAALKEAAMTVFLVVKSYRLAWYKVMVDAYMCRTE
jgi:hypothetical protein